LSFVAIFKPHIKALQIFKAFGFSEEEIKRGIFKKGEGITGKVFKTGVPVVLTDLRSNPAFLNKTRVKDKLRGVPLRWVGT